MVAGEGGAFVSRLAGYVADGLRYWEPRRLLYNGVLALVVLTHFFLALPILWILNAIFVIVASIQASDGKFTDAWRSGNWQPELDKIATAARMARKIGLVVLGGHGLNYRNIDPIAMIGDIEELNIGHSIVARAALVGLDSAVREMIALMRYPRRVASK